ncbi:hypothetical protein NX059_005034 [Plenodomus lindquistii]|nr:hypothetical protein NX059_005034 [Plenodomus lindquistii]
MADTIETSQTARLTSETQRKLDDLKKAIENVLSRVKSSKELLPFFIEIKATSSEMEARKTIASAGEELAELREVYRRLVTTANKNTDVPSDQQIAPRHTAMPVHEGTTSIDNGSSMLEAKYDQLAAKMKEMNALQGEIDQEEHALKVQRLQMSSLPEAVHPPNVNRFTPVQTNTVQVSSSVLHPSILPTPIQRRHDHHRHFVTMPPSYYTVGDIAWYPVLRPTFNPSPGDIQTEFGFVCAKFYPVVIVEKLEDNMIALVISTSGGRGLSALPPSAQRRCTHVVSDYTKVLPMMPFGSNILPEKILSVASEWDEAAGQPKGYEPHPKAYVDMLDTIKIRYDTRFKKGGALTAESARDIVSMRAAVMLDRSRKAMGDDDFGKLLRTWWEG